tara:strand:- start:1842 stop:2426 length:585 start_codon:yes stop_codon:yes gene_type:complete
VFETIKECNNIDQIYVDCSDPSILDIAKDWGFKTILRGKELNTPETSGHDLLNFELNTIEEDIVCQLFVTLPFIESRTIDRAVDLLRSNKDHSSVLALYEMHDRFWFKGKDAEVKPINHEPSSLVGTQYMNSIYRESGFYVFRRQAFLKEGCRITKNFIEMLVDSNECVDIDTHEDFLYAESLERNRRSADTKV